jgi:hypothetical protein
MARFDPLNAVSKGNVMEFITALMTLATVTLAGIGGLYYPYACSVMPGLRGTDAGHIALACYPASLAITALVNIPLNNRACRRGGLGTRGDRQGIIRTTVDTRQYLPDLVVAGGPGSPLYCVGHALTGTLAGTSVFPGRGPEVLFNWQQRTLFRREAKQGSLQSESGRFLRIRLLVGFLDFSLNSASAVDRVAVVTRPLTDLCRVVATACNGGFGACSAAGRSFAGGSNKTLQAGTQFGCICGRQIDFIAGPVKAKPDILVRGSPIQIIYEDDVYFLCHLKTSSLRFGVCRKAGCFYKKYEPHYGTTSK